MEPFQPGALVEARCYGGETVKRRVVEDIGRTVVICNEREYQGALAEGRNPEGIGFPRSAIRAYNGDRT
jgi:hypothetical protein